MRIEVTRQDIERGSHGACWGCPIAIAVSRVAGCAVGVTERRVLFDQPGWLYHGSPLPSEAAAWMHRFDCREEVDPFSFDLPEPTSLFLVRA